MSQVGGPPAAMSGSSRGRRRIGWLLTAVGAAVVGGGALAVGLGSGPRDQTAAAPEKGVKVRSSLELFEVNRTDFEITTTATGELRARSQVELRNQLDSETTITEIIAEGTSVKKGDVLVQMNAETIQTRLEEESLSLETARAAVVEANEAYEIQLSENESAKRAAALKLALAELELSKWEKGELKSKLQELEHNVDRTTKDEQRLREFYDRSVLLRDKDFYSEDKLKQDQLALDQAVAARDKATLALEIHKTYEEPKDRKQKTSDVEEARAEVDRVVRQNASKLASKEADKKNKQQSLAIREQKFAKYKEQIDAATIKAPNDGLVVYASSLENSRWGGDEGPLQVGSKVWPNQTLIVLPDTSEMIAAVKVHESLAGRIRKGQPATIKIDAAGDRRYTGTIESVGILAEQTNRWQDPTLREYTVRIAMNIPKDSAPIESTMAGSAGAGAVTGHGLRPSMRCEADIVLGKVADAVTVPIQSVYSEGLLRYVHVADATGSRYTRRPVQLGQRSDRFAEIRAGVNPGERVLLRKPEPSEILGKGWNAQELAAVGLEMNDAGDILPSAAAIAARAGAGGPGGPGKGGPGRGGPDGRRPAGDAAAAKGDAGEHAKPAASKDDQDTGAAKPAAEPASSPAAAQPAAAEPAAGAPVPAKG